MKKILIIEREKAISEPLERLADALNLPYETVYTRNNAVRVFSQGNIIAVFLNIELALIDPGNLLEDFHSIAIRNQIGHVPVIYMYSHKDSQSYRNLIDKPRDGELHKPFKLEEALDILNRTVLLEHELINSPTSVNKIEFYRDFAVGFHTWLDNYRDKLSS